MDKNTKEPLPEQEYEYPYWNRVYLAVILFAAALIFVLWRITLHFS